MIDRAVAAGIGAAWAAGDEVYGADPALRKSLAQHGLGFVLAVAKSHRFTTGIGTRRAVDLAVRLPRSAWQRLSAGAGAKGPRWYHWALIEVTDPALTSSDTGSDTSSAVAAGTNWLLVRRRISDGQYAFYRAHAPWPVPLAELVRVAGVRWKIEESFAGGKELTAMDEHQVRTWTSWRRWTVLAMLAHAFLSVTTAAAAPPTPSDGHEDDATTAAGRPALIPLTRNEIRRLFTTTVRVLRTLEHRLHWSQWRRHHQAVARASHHRRRTDQQP